MPAKKKTAKQKKAEESEEISVAVVGLDTGTSLLSPEDLSDLIGDGSDALDDIGAEDMTIPLIGIIQSLSEQRKKQSERYIEGAEEGMLFDNVSDELFDGDEGLEVIPVDYRKVWAEWVPRKQGGGFVGEHASEEDAERDKLPHTEIIETAIYTVLYREKGGEDFRPAMVPMKKSQLKVARRWNTQLKLMRVPTSNGRKKPPMHMTLWNLTAVPASSADGDYFNYAVRSLGVLQDRALIIEAKDFGEAVADRPLRMNPAFSDERPGSDEDAEIDVAGGDEAY